MARPVLTPGEWHAAQARLDTRPASDRPGPMRRKRLPARIATRLASLEFRLGGA
jgi:hypothetical protein